MKQIAWPGVVQLKLQFRHGQPPVQRHQHGPQPGAGKQQGQRIAAVFRQHRQPVPGDHAGCAQASRQPLHPLVKFGIRPAQRLRWCQQRGRSRANLGVIGQPVGRVGAQHDSSLGNLVCLHGSKIADGLGNAAAVEDSPDAASVTQTDAPSFRRIPPAEKSGQSPVCATCLARSRSCQALAFSGRLRSR